MILRIVRDFAERRKDDSLAGAEQPRFRFFFGFWFVLCFLFCLGFFVLFFLEGDFKRIFDFFYWGIWGGDFF